MFKISGSADDPVSIKQFNHLLGNFMVFEDAGEADITKKSYKSVMEYTNKDLVEMFGSLQASRYYNTLCNAISSSNPEVCQIDFIGKIVNFITRQDSTSKLPIKWFGASMREYYLNQASMYRYSPVSTAIIDYYLIRIGI
ncbi:MAG: hypothetical protein INQ03_21030 [Candidatus Heimdallarchaeota archaeon]|nr:hypothetical protein [Candidatus Heimdallarchaeota archaeon]